MSAECEIGQLRCTVCKRTLAESEFVRDRRYPGGRKPRCFRCDRERSKAYYWAHREQHLATMQRRNDAVRVARGPRLCPCGAPAVSNRHRYCRVCRDRKDRRRRRERERSQMRQLAGITAALRGYGSSHKKLRKRWAMKIAGGGVPCSRCGGLIGPGELWDLDHSDDRRSYRGPSHRACNRATTGRKPVGSQSRLW
jgi:hypothetical protein